MTTIVSRDTVRNGVDTGKLFATLDAVKAQPQAAQFQFRASNRWVGGTHSRTTISGFYGVGQEQSPRARHHPRRRPPGVLVGGDNGPTPSSTCCTRSPAA